MQNQMGMDVLVLGCSRLPVTSRFPRNHRESLEKDGLLEVGDRPGTGSFCAFGQRTLGRDSGHLAHVSAVREYSCTNN